MRIGLFFGSFNPVHHGHLILARTLLNLTDLQEIWFVVSPHNPHKEKSSLLNQYERLHMVELALKHHEGMRASSIEFSLAQPSYTIHTLAHLEEKYPTHTFSLIIGEDNLRTFHKWKNHELILDRYRLLVYPRVGYSGSVEISHTHVEHVPAPVIEISSTQIRNFIKAGKPVDFLVPDSVRDFLLKEGYYS